MRFLAGNALRLAILSGLAIFVGLSTPPSFAQSATFTTLYTFSGGADGKFPAAALVQAPNGDLYGVTQYGGSTNDGGTVFKITPDGVFTSIHSFAGSGVGGSVVTEGNHPFGSLILASDGKLYGTTMRGGAGQCSNGGTELGCGSGFSITLDGVFSSIYAFTGQLDGASPSGVIEARDGNFYGTSLTGPIQSLPRAYKLTPAWSLTTIHSFSDGAGASDHGKLVEGSDVNFYGTTVLGGASDQGTVFRLSPAGEYEVLHNFAGFDGGLPFGSLVEGLDGYFYGVTNIGGGVDSLGTVFRISTSGDFAVLHEFAGGDEGAFPISGMIQASDGLFYGTTNAGGTGDSAECGFGCGTIFRISTGGTLETLHSFEPASGGPVPNGLIEGQDGEFYGTTIAGGSSANGTVFKLTLDTVPPPPPPPPPPDGGGGGGTTTFLVLLGLLALVWRAESTKGREFMPATENPRVGGSIPPLATISFSDLPASTSADF